MGIYVCADTDIHMHTITQLSGTVEYTDCTSAEGYPSSNNECAGYDTKQSDGEVPMMLELWGMRGTSSLPSLPELHWPGVVAPDSALSMGLIELNCVRMLNWITWKKLFWYLNCVLILLYSHVPYHNDSIIVKTDARRKIDAWRITQEWRTQEDFFTNILPLTLFVRVWKGCSRVCMWEGAGGDRT